MPVEPVCGVVLTGGTGRRLGGADKAMIGLAGRTLLDRALATLADAERIVVVGPPRPTRSRTGTSVEFVVEDPPRGGPAAGLLAAADVLTADVLTAGWVVVLAVDMPGVGRRTVRRLLAAAAGHDGAWLLDADGRRPLAGVVSLAALRRVDPGTGRRDSLPMHRLLADLDLAAVPARPGEEHDVDTWADLQESGDVNLHDWIDELMDALDVDTEVDEALVLDLARDAAHQVERRAAPISTYLLGYAAGRAGASEEEIEALAAKATLLAQQWDRPADAADPDDADVAVPDDSGVDHSGDAYSRD